MGKLDKVIEVTDKDIRLGKAESSHFCPIARAAKRVLKNRDLEVDQYGIHLDPNASEVHYTISKAAEKFIERFDDGRAVKPFSFTAKYCGL